MRRKHRSHSASGWDARAQLRRSAHLLTCGRCTPALTYDLTFPEVFYPSGVPYSHVGFNTVLGNPPWEQFDVAEEEYWCRFDLAVLSVSDKHSRKPLIEAAAVENPLALGGWNNCSFAQEEYARILDGLYRWQSADVGGRTTTGRPDLYRLFSERGTQLNREVGLLGMGSAVPPFTPTRVQPAFGNCT